MDEVEKEDTWEAEVYAWKIGILELSFTVRDVINCRTIIPLRSLRESYHIGQADLISSNFMALRRPKL